LKIIFIKFNLPWHQASIDVAKQRIGKYG